MKTIDIEYAKSVLDYNPETGILTWTSRVAHRIHVGDVAGTKDKDGYIIITLKNKPYKAHRLAYAMFHNKQPVDIDHINTIKNDNRIVNIRECNQSQNCANKTINKKNTSKFKGVSWCKREGKWYARVGKDGVRKSLGYFLNIEDAAAAYAEAAKIHHGDFARLN